MLLLYVCVGKIDGRYWAGADSVFDKDMQMQISNWNLTNTCNQSTVGSIPICGASCLSQPCPWAWQMCVCVCVCEYLCVCVCVRKYVSHNSN